MSEKSVYRSWEHFKQNLIKETTVSNENEAERFQRAEKLKKAPEKFFKYYFPNYSYAEPAQFQKQATRRLIQNNTIYEVRAWARELAKSARTMMEVLYLALNGKIKNVILISHSKDNAVNLLTPYKLNLEFNQRIINDFGEQKSPLNWEEDMFVTRDGVSFMCFGAGQSPRGTRNEAIRPDVIIFDDIDTDEEVRNPDRIQKKWDWIEQAVIPTTSVSKSKRIIFCGNIIGKDTCITRAMRQADYSKVINIRDKYGKSTWPEKNSEADIDYLLSKISHRSQQKEFFNNPVSEGTIFKKIVWDKIPRIDSFKFLVKYGDPAYSNKRNAQNSQKGVVLVGYKNGYFYVISCRLNRATNQEFVKWYNELEADYSHEKTQQYNYVENNTLQNPFFEQVLRPEFQNQNIPIIPDNRNKPDKFFRIEGNLEPLNSTGRLIFNSKEKDNVYMKELEEQFLDFSQDTSRIIDGPDAVEGAVWIIKNKIQKDLDIRVKSINKRNKKYRF